MQNFHYHYNHATNVKCKCTCTQNFSTLTAYTFYRIPSSHNNVCAFNVAQMHVYTTSSVLNTQSVYYTPSTEFPLAIIMCVLPITIIQHHQLFVHFTEFPLPLWYIDIYLPLCYYLALSLPVPARDKGAERRGHHRGAETQEQRKSNTNTEQTT